MSPPVFHKFWSAIYRRKPTLYREVYNLFSLRKEDAAYQHKHCVSPYPTLFGWEIG